MKKILFLILFVSFTQLVHADDKVATVENQQSPTINTSISVLKVIGNTVNLGGNPKSVAIAKDHSCAIIAVGKTDELKCWGSNDVGQLGAGDTNPHDQPVQINLGSQPKVVAVTDHMTCSLQEIPGKMFGFIKSRELKCWGEARHNQLATSSTNLTSPSRAVNLGNGETPNNVMLNSDVSCVVLGGLLDGDQVKCKGILGPGIFGLKEAEPKTSSSDQTAKLNFFLIDSILSNTKSCAILRSSQHTGTGKLKCWDQQGDNDIKYDGTVRTIAGNEDVQCAVVRKSGKDGLQCWGNNSYGIFANGKTESSNDPSQPVDLGGKVKKLVLGRQHACAIVVATKSDQLKCWGSNQVGQLSSDNKDSVFATPVVMDIGGKVKDVFAGADSTCAVIEGSGSDQLKCW